MDEDATLESVSIEQLLTKSVEMHRSMNHQLIGDYLCIEDFVLRHGREFRHAALPHNIQPMEKRCCFKNAGTLAIAFPNEFLYAEGVGFGVGWPMHHGWIINRNGEAVDPTWDHIETPLYYGVIFNPTWWRKQTMRTGQPMMIDRWEERHPLLTGKWRLEEALMTERQWNAWIRK